jgi:hypothetical protein
MRLRSVLTAAAIAATATVGPVVVSASSHREAPFISKNPKVDGTDYYAFLSYETGRTCVGTGAGPCGYVTLLANYIPLEDAAGGPNFFTMDPDALYEIMIDNTGDGIEDLTFQFQFTSTLTGVALPIGAGSDQKMVAIPFAYAGGTNPATGSNAHGFGAINSAGTSGVSNVSETYTINLVAGPRRTGSATAISDIAGNATFKKPVDNIGPNTVGQAGAGSNTYENYANAFVTSFDIPGCTPTRVTAGTHSKVFVGQRQEGFAVNLGQVFDTVHFTAGPNATGLADVLGNQDQGLNDVANKNVTTIALEVPAECLIPAASGNTTAVFGSWTTASVRQARVINPTATFAAPSREGGPWAQVSRLGMPLVNEVIIGLPDKDRWNESEPKDDAQWDNYVTNPTLPVVVALLFGGAGVQAPGGGVAVDRPDLVQAFGTGVALPDVGGATVNVNQTTMTTPAVAEMLRLNTNILGLGLVAGAAAKQNSALGALGCFDNPTATTGTLALIDPAPPLGHNPDCDPFGFPNGRRPGDDVTDIELRAAMGAIINTADSPTGGCLHPVGQKNSLGVATGPAAIDTLGPGNCLQLVDGAARNAAVFQNHFPYLNSPLGAK